MSKPSYLKDDWNEPYIALILRGRGKNRRGAEGAEEEEERISLEFGSPIKISVVNYYYYFTNLILMGRERNLKGAKSPKEEEETAEAQRTQSQRKR